MVDSTDTSLLQTVKELIHTPTTAELDKLAQTSSPSKGSEISEAPVVK